MMPERSKELVRSRFRWGQLGMMLGRSRRQERCRMGMARGSSQCQLGQLEKTMVRFQLGKELETSQCRLGQMG